MMEQAGAGVARAIQERWQVPARDSGSSSAPATTAAMGWSLGATWRKLARRSPSISTARAIRSKTRTTPPIERRGLIQRHRRSRQQYRVLRLRLRTADILVDALLGTGVDRPIGGELATLLREVQEGLQARAAGGGPGDSQRSFP
jgi:NAD(P)H-hydrate repair Nnr-like enzyme with NAD(P)H-hydrate epimerase domain